MNKTYAITDLHGMWDLWESIKNYCDETDTIYFLGDAIDRGKDGIKLMKDLLHDKRVIYLKGNHEEIMSIVAPKMMNGVYDDDCRWWADNGGELTAESFLALPLEEQTELLYEIDHLIETDCYINKYDKNIFMCHSGAILPREIYQYTKTNPYLWDRDHFKDPWDLGEENFIVHGHTPTQLLSETFLGIRRVNGILRYADNHKICLDTGCFATGICALFDLDELKVEAYFSLEGIM